MSSSNKSIQLVKYGKPETAFSITNINLPDLDKEDVEIEVSHFGLNYADVMARNGLYKEAPELPCVLGYEVVGKIVKVGEKVPKKLLGKKVVAFTRFGGYSQFVQTKYYAVAEINNLKEGEAVSLATQYVTAYYMSNFVAPVQENENILIHAASGGVGTALIQLLQLKNVNIIANTGRDEKIEYLRNLGVQHIINYNKTEYIAEIQKILGNQKLDRSFNPVGGSTFKKDWQFLGPTGTLYLYGGSERSGKKWGVFSDLNFVRKMGLLIPITLMGSSKSIVGINMLRVAEFKPFVLQNCLNEVVKLAETGKIVPKIHTVFSANEISEAHKLLESGESTGKIIVKW